MCISLWFCFLKVIRNGVFLFIYLFEKKQVVQRFLNKKSEHDWNGTTTSTAEGMLFYWISQSRTSTTLKCPIAPTWWKSRKKNVKEPDISGSKYLRYCYQCEGQVRTTTYIPKYFLQILRNRFVMTMQRTQTRNRMCETFISSHLKVLYTAYAVQIGFADSIYISKFNTFFECVCLSAIGICVLK